MREFSLITVAHHRNNHLKNLLKGVLESNIIPNQIIIVDFDNSVELPALQPVGILRVTLNTPDDKISLSAARNAGAQVAHNQNLIFLDVDCIPSTHFFEKMLSGMEECNGLVMGTPRYLNTAVADNFTEEELEEQSELHPSRPAQTKTLQKCDDYALFWSLCFGITKSNFIKIGGFDENYTGYGGEDTDFAFMAKEHGLDFQLSEATAYHQPHDVYTPPVNHLTDIVKNSTLFKKKWGWWPMEGWLNEFEDMGLIEREKKNGKEITQVKHVDPHLLEQCRNEVAAFK